MNLLNTITLNLIYLSNAVERGYSMQLADIDTRGKTMSALILQTTSTKLNMFIEDRIKLQLKTISDTSLEISTKEDIKRVKELQGIVPPMSVKWFVKVDMDKVHDKELFKVIRQSNTCCFLLITNRYQTFKLAQSQLDNKEDVYNYYAATMRRWDFLYVYDLYTPEKNKLTKVLFDYVIQSYNSDIEAIFDLLEAMHKGQVIKSRSDIAKICGIGNNSVETFIFQMIKPLSGSDIGLKTVVRSRIKTGLDLANTLDYPTFYKRMIQVLKNCTDIKVLLISGDVYKELRNLPKGYDERILSKYQKYLWKIKEIPLSRFLRFRQLLGKKQWYTETDFLNFIYRFYSEEAILKAIELGKELT